MIKIRYRDLEPGINGDAVREGPDVVVYLVPGLTAEQRKAVIRRLRQAARRGQKPPLPSVPLVAARAADRVLMSARNLAAIVRLHPAGSMVPMFGLASLIVLFLLTSVSVHMLHAPSAPGSPPAVGGAQPGHVPLAGHEGPGFPRTGVVSPARSGGIALTSGRAAGKSSVKPPVSSAAAASGGTPRASSSPSGSGSAGSGGSTTVSVSASPGSSTSVTVSAGSGSTGAKVSSSQGSAGATVASGSNGTSVGAGASVAGVSAGANVSVTGSGISATVSAGTNSATPAATSTTAPAKPSGTCLDIGPLGICLDL